MNILITGAGGQLGRTFRDVAANGEHKCFFMLSILHKNFT